MHLVGPDGSATRLVSQLPYVPPLAVTSDGTLLVLDPQQSIVRRLGADGRLAPVIGLPGAGGLLDQPSLREVGDGGPAAAARLLTPAAIAATREGGVLIADAANHRVRQVAPDGSIATIAGTGLAGFSGEGGPAVRARLNTPCGVAETPTGEVLVADNGNARVRLISRDGRITTVAGGGRPYGETFCDVLGEGGGHGLGDVGYEASRFLYLLGAGPRPGRAASRSEAVQHTGRDGDRTNKDGRPGYRPHRECAAGRGDCSLSTRTRPRHLRRLPSGSRHPGGGLRESHSGSALSGPASASRAPWWRRVGPWTAASVAFATSLIALVFTLWPGLKPDPRDRLNAQVSVFAVDRQVTLEEWLRRTTFSEDEYRAARDRYLESVGVARTDADGLLASAGQSAYVASIVEGFKRRSVRLRWSLYEQATDRRIPRFSNQSGARLSLEAPSDRTLQEIWLPPLPRGMYYMRVALYDGDGTLLDVADSRAFRAP